MNHQHYKKLTLRKTITIVSLIIISILTVAHVIVSNRFVTSGKTLVELERDITTLKEKNSDLAQQVASASALLTIEQKAKELGFEKSTATVFIPSRLPVAFGATH